eukprot:Blabericola_migrator_1__3987@NODE_2209_length_3119_cov_87_495085_g1391_i0_p5_GENE_NODE_2209_length_3119_cov_87_495085_g1391_i0NODE_2209_length_3119_cov_87_495085_g1391_i0_p5_ORF_typecomplete_len131_score30_05DUF3510/PF12022_8/6e02DUF3510/PF12022_8/0_085_NODE_2209_length_3119_cov_87_495085_g1391_i010271419
MNHFLADLSAVKNSFRQLDQQEISSEVTSSATDKGSAEGDDPVRQTLRVTHTHIPIRFSQQSVVHYMSPGLSFVKAEASALLNPDQLNVAVGVSENGYPTVIDLIDEMQKKRDATERLERAKLLQMYNHL